MCFSLVREWVSLFNGLLTLFGLGLVGIAIYLLASVQTTFGWVICGIGVWITITGGLGVYATGNHNMLLVRLYSIMFTLILLLQSVLSIGLLFYSSSTISILESMDDRGEASAVKSYLDNHADNLKIVALVFLIAEACTFLLTCLCQRQIANMRPLDDDGNEALLSPITLRSSTAYDAAAGEPSKADAKRAELNAKYGNLWQKSNRQQESPI